ncbi:MAG: DNRLRE domain-containing protein [Candidatus Hydrogenedentes bacterium]|nr:DNRLRE domain-containing protein [Candidatus Hydrogenedentota bacterium]
MKYFRACMLVILMLTVPSAPAVALGESLVLVQGTDGYTGFEDTSLFSENVNSGGGTDGIFSGTNGQFHNRRALIRADLSGIAPGSTILSVSLTLTVMMSGNNNGDLDYTLHRVTGDWGEGSVVGLSEGGFGAPADPGDATWQSAFHGTTLWNTAGGDYSPVISGTATAGTAGSVVTWSGTGLRNDVQEWVDNPGGNFGWIIRSTQEGEFKLVKKFHSSEAFSDRPVLTIEYLPPGVSLPFRGAIVVALALGVAGAMLLARRRPQPE